MPRKWNTESFSKKVKEIDPSYILVSEYKNNRDKVQLYHKTCGNYYYVSPTNFLRNIGWCSYCAQQKRLKAWTKTQDKFEKEVHELVNDEYNVIGKYKNANTKIKFEHNTCHKNFLMTPSNFLQGQRCPYCNSSIYKRYNLDDVQKIIIEKLDDSYILVSDYKNNHTPVTVLHKLCNNNWITTLRNIKGGNRCPFCTVMTKGEERIYKYLSENGYTSIFQQRFSECKRKESLPFDFYIPDKKILIEYDGIFHYKPIYGKEQLKEQQENDIIKDIFAKNNNYKLIRIPYWEIDNIEKILENALL